MAPSQAKKQDARLALIVQQSGKPQQVLVRYLSLLLSYRYGLDIMVVRQFVEAFSAMRKNEGRIVSTFVVQNRAVESRASIAPLNDNGAIPLFLLFPGPLVAEHKTLCRRMTNVHFCSWENAFRHTGSSLHKVIAAVFAEMDLDDVLAETASTTPEESSQRLQHRMEKVSTLPTLPDVALNIIRMVEDPNSTVEELEQVLLGDPAVVHKVIQVVNSSLFAGATGRTDWQLQESIVRLGRRKVGAIALQIKLMNSLVRPEESEFDLPRFWRHSVACAVIADRICSENRVAFPGPIAFSTYWTASLLHDIGKLVLGFLFWNHFSDVLAKVGEESVCFREAEAQLGDQATHEFLGRVMLDRSKLDGPLAEAVGSHNSADDSTEPLVWLVHLADNLAKEMGLGYLDGEPICYSSHVLDALHLDREGTAKLAEELRPQVSEHVEEQVRLCLGQE